MRKVGYLLACVLAVACLLAASSVRAQQEKGEPIGKQIGGAIGNAVEEARQTASQWANDLEKSFQKARAAVDRMGVEARVYARLHWDKALNDASLSVDVRPGGVTVLEGTVATEAAKAKAGQLAEDTVGVQQVANHLSVLPPPNR